MRTRIAIALVLVSFLTGCASSLKVSEISNDLKPGSAVNGIPFRAPKRFSLTVYELTDAGYKEVHKETVTLADPDRLFVLGFESQPLSSATVELKLNADNTLSEVKLKSDSKGDEVMTEVTTQLAAIGAADKASAAADVAKATAAQAQTTAAASLRNAAEKARMAAELAKLEADTLERSGTANELELQKAKDKARSAMLDANEAGRLAGKGENYYFPDVVP